MSLLKPLTVFSVEQYKEAVLYFQEEYLAPGTGEQAQRVYAFLVAVEGDAPQ